MTRQTVYFSLFAFVAVVFLASVPFASAQGPGGAAVGFGLIDADYDRYVQLFLRGKEPNLAPTEAGGSDTWRRLYTNHRWRDYAEGSEFREPLRRAQVLMGIYLTAEVDHRLTYQINSIILNKAALGTILSERMTLDMIGSYFEGRARPDPVDEIVARYYENPFELPNEFAYKLEDVGAGDDFYSEDELYQREKQWTYNISRNIDIMARRRMISGTGISNARLGEARSTQNLFRHGEKGWEAQYYYMREKFDVLDTLAQKFAFNWLTSLEQENGRDSLKEYITLTQGFKIERDIRRIAEAINESGGLIIDGVGMGNAGMGGMGMDGMGMDGMGMDGMGMDGMGMGAAGAAVGRSVREISEEDIGKAIEKEVERRIQWAENRHKAYQYVVGVYQSREFHLETLQKIYNYFLEAAEEGNPLAQYHLALFIRYLGDIVDPYEYDTRAACEAESQIWLDRAKESDLIRERAEKLQREIAEAVGKARRRDERKVAKVETLFKVEEDKLDMYDDLLMRVRERIGSSTGGGGGGGRGGSLGSGGGMGGGGMQGGTRGGGGGSGTRGGRGGGGGF